MQYLFLVAVEQILGLGNAEEAWVLNSSLFQRVPKKESQEEIWDGILKKTEKVKINFADP